MNLAWNGFGYEGGLALGELIRGNKYIRELDVSHNRLNWEGALLIAKGLKENDTLEVLKARSREYSGIRINYRSYSIRILWTN